MWNYIFRIPPFRKWRDDYEKTFHDEAYRWAQKSEEIPEEDFPIYLPEGFHESVFNKYVAYRTEVATRRLVQGTWALAAGTIILSIATILLTLLKG